ncbi:hypothetical protein C2845_PM03G02230 [Panicum miliaceum]|uniref:Uncharacterized protein n=1 Tax=Panicum miliaceum TaxID=4540 RepID=A0A3L6T977_PANMI|nr:hypothetical protein C2845_PM03G02230 [Panicum miliaceum]
MPTPTPTPTPGSKTRRKDKNAAAATRARARLTRVRRGKKNKASSGPSGEAAAAKQPVYLVVEHGVEDPTHSILEVAAGAAPRPLLYGRRGMSFAAVGTRYGPRIVGLGLDRNLIYNPETSKEVEGPPLLDRMAHPILIPHGGELFDLDENSGWRYLPPPPIFPCRLNPLEYRDPPEVQVAAYAVVGSHILLSVQQEKGTCAFDVVSMEWEMVDDRNLPFIGQAVPVGGHRFVACSKARDGAPAVYYIEVFPPGTTSTGRSELSIIELPVKSKGIVPRQHLCAMGTGRFSSFDIRSVDPGPEAKLDKARIVHRSYSLEEGDDASANSVVVVKEQRQIYKLRDPSCHLAYPSPVVAALTV